jgi:hypothetical protein
MPDAEPQIADEKLPDTIDSIAASKESRPSTIRVLFVIQDEIPLSQTDPKSAESLAK